MKSRNNEPKPIDGHAADPVRRKRGAPPKPIVEHPEPMYADWTDPPGFQQALTLHMDRHGDTIWQLHRSVSLPEERFNRTTIREWRAGRKAPQSATSLAVLARIERRYGLPEGYFREKLPHSARAIKGLAADMSIEPAERRRLAWHLPENFDSLPLSQREEILEWVRRVIITGATDYRRFQAGALRQRFAVRFPALSRRCHPRFWPAILIRNNW